MAYSKQEDIFSGPLFALITGASQGLGRSFVVGLAAKVAAKSVIAITARNSDGLQQTSELAKDHRRKICQDCDIEIVCVTADLSDFKDIESLVGSCVAGHTSRAFTSVLVIHNAGSLGDASKDMCDFLNPLEVSDYFTLNIAHLPTITGNFLKWVKDSEHKPRTVIVNVSSFFAIQPNPCLSLYCAGKAARDQLFKVFAVENPDVKVLNWAPGSLQTAMLDTLVKTGTRHNVPESLQKTKSEGLLLTCEESTARFLKVLQKDEYKSGQHVDVFE